MLSETVITMRQCIGYIAQWLERLTADQQVPGSNPGVPSLDFLLLHIPIIWCDESRGTWVCISTAFQIQYANLKLWAAAQTFFDSLHFAKPEFSSWLRNGFRPQPHACPWMSFVLAMKQANQMFQLCMQGFQKLATLTSSTGLRSLVAERQTCNLKVLGSIPSEGLFILGQSSTSLVTKDMSSPRRGD